MTALVRRDKAEGGQPMGQTPEDRRGAGHPMERDHGPPRARTELVHMQPHDAIMGQRLTAGR